MKIARNRVFSTQIKATTQTKEKVVGCIVEHDNSILLCKRGIEPCKGLWTLPAGFLEIGESTAEGAVRETLEETGAQVEIIAPYAHFDVPIIGQSYLLFRAKLLPPFNYQSGQESLDVQLYKIEEIPFEQLAFSSISVALRLYREDVSNQQMKFHHGVIKKSLGSSPNDPSTFVFLDHIQLPIVGSLQQYQVNNS
eukprot:TRINITY_DN5664_c0_g1_i2.p1 TRINITY_DN5664_c0_g1~~TRINITY_DN5664_c0_g1_i2.p1  ORF type:complete len:229 (-),score=15.31 TRINITY_DN5664_c0_g1_i2:23-607(-)